MYDIIVVGGGVAGMSAAISAAVQGAKVALLTKGELGGKLSQNIHNGCGTEFFGEDMTGPEFVARLTDKIKQANIRVIKNAHVTAVSEDLKVTVERPKRTSEMKAKAIILATGSKENNDFSDIKTPYAGIFSAVEAQRLTNAEGKRIGKKAVIYGSNTLALIIARRLSLEGAKVVCVCEKGQAPQSMPKDIVECLEDFDIPLYLNTTITPIGQPLSAVKIYSEDGEKIIECDTLVLSPRLLPDDSLTKIAQLSIDENTHGVAVDSQYQTSTKCIFAAGNVVHTHTSVDNAAFEGAAAGKGAAQFVKIKPQNVSSIKIIAGNGIKYALPQTAYAGETVRIFFNPKEVRKGARLNVLLGDKLIFAKRYAALLPGLLESIEINPGENDGDITVSLEA